MQTQANPSVSSVSKTDILATMELATPFQSPISKLTIEQRLHHKLVANFIRGHVLPPIVLLSCEKSLSKLTVVNDMTLAKAFRQSWTMKPLKQPHVPTVAICHSRGKVIKVYKDLIWVSAELDSYTDGENLQDLRKAFEMTELGVNGDLWNFYGNEANHLPGFKNWVGMDLSAELTQPGMANPVRYVNCR